MNDNNTGSGGNDSGSEIGAWILIIIAFAVFWPVGLFLLIRKLKQYYDGSQTKSSASRVQTTPPPKAEEKTNKENKTAKKRRNTEKSLPTFLLIIGIILLVLGASYASNAFDIISGTSDGSAITEGVKSLFYLIGGGASFFCRGRIIKRTRRKKKCEAIITGREVVKLSEISQQLGISHDTAKSDLEDMIEDGAFGPTAYIDIGLDSFVRSFDAAEQERQRRYSADMSRDVSKTPRGRYETVLEELRNLDDDIEDEPISEKIRRIEDISSKIFKVVEEHPEKASDTRKFMDYYLPTTLKLLRSYATLERQGISGDNIKNAKADIERVLDTLTAGFTQQLDQLFRTEAMDISADIDVLESMMKNDGLTGDNPFTQQRPSH